MKQSHSFFFLKINLILNWCFFLKNYFRKKLLKYTKNLKKKIFIFFNFLWKNTKVLKKFFLLIFLKEIYSLINLYSKFYFLETKKILLFARKIKKLKKKNFISIQIFNFPDFTHIMNFLNPFCCLKNKQIFISFLFLINFFKKNSKTKNISIKLIKNYIYPNLKFFNCFLHNSDLFKINIFGFFFKKFIKNKKNLNRQLIFHISLKIMTKFFNFKKLHNLINLFFFIITKKNKLDDKKKEKCFCNIENNFEFSQQLFDLKYQHFCNFFIENYFYKKTKIKDGLIDSTISRKFLKKKCFYVILIKKKNLLMLIIKVYLKCNIKKKKLLIQNKIFLKCNLFLIFFLKLKKKLLLNWENKLRKKNIFLYLYIIYYNLVYLFLIKICWNLKFFSLRKKFMIVLIKNTFDFKPNKKIQKKNNWKFNNIKFFFSNMKLFMTKNNFSFIFWNRWIIKQDFFKKKMFLEKNFIFSLKKFSNYYFYYIMMETIMIFELIYGNSFKFINCLKNLSVKIFKNFLENIFIKKIPAKIEKLFNIFYKNFNDFFEVKNLIKSFFYFGCLDLGRKIFLKYLINSSGEKHREIFNTWIDFEFLNKNFQFIILFVEFLEKNQKKFNQDQFFFIFSKFSKNHNWINIFSFTKFFIKRLNFRKIFNYFIKII
jgi:hypothetical protein